MVRGGLFAMDLLVSTEWLQQQLGNPELVVLFAGQGRQAFDAGHIPGAGFLALDDLVQSRAGVPHQLPPAEALRGVFADLGLRDTSLVVLCGDGVLPARAFFTLEYLGFAGRVALLAGGMSQWIREGRPLSQREPEPAPGRITLPPCPGVAVSTAAIQCLAAGEGDCVLLDARSAAEYCGVVNSQRVPKAGHIAGACHLDWKRLVRAGSAGELLPRRQLSQVFADAGVRAGQTVITYCRTGMRSSLAYFVARYLGYAAAMYDGSVYEWVVAGQDLVPSWAQPAAAR